MMMQVLSCSEKTWNHPSTALGAGASEHKCTRMERWLDDLGPIREEVEVGRVLLSFLYETDCQ